MERILKPVEIILDALRVNPFDNRESICLEKRHKIKAPDQIVGRKQDA